MQPPSPLPKEESGDAYFVRDAVNGPWYCGEWSFYRYSGARGRGKRSNVCMCGEKGDRGVDRLTVGLV
jgi:hypothetical protein